MRDEIVYVTDHGEIFPTFFQGGGQNSPKHSGRAETVALQRLSQIRAAIPRVFVAEHRERAAVRISGNDDSANAFVQNIGREDGFKLFPHPQKTAVGKPDRPSHTLIRFRGEVQIVFPVGFTVRVLEKYVQNFIFPFHGVICGYPRLQIGDFRALQHQIVKSHTTINAKGDGKGEIAEIAKKNYGKY